MRRGLSCDEISDHRRPAGRRRPKRNRASRSNPPPTSVNPHGSVANLRSPARPVAAHAPSARPAPSILTAAFARTPPILTARSVSSVGPHGSVASHGSVGTLRSPTQHRPCSRSRLQSGAPCYIASSRKARARITSPDLGTRRSRSANERTTTRDSARPSADRASNRDRREA